MFAVLHRALGAALCLIACAAPLGTAAARDLTVTRSGQPSLRIAYTLRGDRLAFTVRDGRRTVQTFTVETDAPQAAPGLSDADGDGVPDLWVPVTTGNANIQYAIWRLDPATGRFAAAGDISGIDFRRDDDGYLIAIGRNGCCAMTQEFHRFDVQGRLQLAFTIDRRFTPEDGRPDRVTVECEASAAAMEPPAALVARYCNLAAGARLPGRAIR